MADLRASTVPQTDEEYDTSKVKVTVIGDAEIGKSCLLMGYRPDNSSLVPSIFNSITINKTVTIDNQTNEQRQLTIELCDTGRCTIQTIESYKIIQKC